MRKKNGFTLIELLAVIIILGILMIIAIPSVTKYISDSRKSAYIDTARSIIDGARNLVNEGKLEMYDTDTTYYIDSACIKTEGSSKSPYGEFTKAYVVVTYDGKGYDYYWTSVDDAGQGIKTIIKYDKLDIENIESDLKNEDISTLRTIDGREKVILITERNECKKEGTITENLVSISSETGEKESFICKKATSLHKKTCASSTGCGAIVGNGNEITYGAIPNGTPKSGDAYDCDVNNDGIYDSSTERFYYLKSEGSNSTLIYYKNLNNNARYKYGINSENWHGPTVGYQYLPSSSVWSNPLLIAPGVRNIVNDQGSGTTDNGSKVIESFDYADKVARFLTVQEVNSACGINVGNYRTGELDSCYWLFENVNKFESNAWSMNSGYWLETPGSSSSYIIWLTSGGNRFVTYFTVAYDEASECIRPVITVKTINIEK